MGLHSIWGEVYQVSSSETPGLLIALDHRVRIFCYNSEKQKGEILEQTSWVQDS